MTIFYYSINLLLALAFWLGLLSTGSAWAQTAASSIQSPAAKETAGLASVSGKVVDSLTNEPIEQAEILISKVGVSHKRQEMETGKDGLFVLKNLEPGDWTLKIYSDKHHTKVYKFSLAGGQKKVVSAVMEETEPVESLKVSSKRKLVNPERLATDTSLDRTLLNNYKSGNDVKDLLTSTPGILNDGYGNIITRGEHNMVNYVLDGVVLPEAAGVLQQQQFVSPRSLQSMDVEVGGYSASDGGGPLGSVVKMKSLPINAKPNLDVGGQLGGPLAGSIYYYASGALGQEPNTTRNKIRIESSGTAVGSSIYLQPPIGKYRRNNGANLNILNKIEYTPSERNRFRLTAGINEAFLQIPIPGTSEAYGVRQHQHDRQDFVILSWRHKFNRLFDESNLHIVNGFYSETFRSRNVFDPLPIINGDEAVLQSVSPQARRFNYVFSLQGDITKTLLKTHHLKAGVYSELRPVRSNISAFFYNNDPYGEIPYAAMISPFTGGIDGSQFQRNGNYKGFRYLQSAYFEDKWTPKVKILNRLTLNSGVRFDLYHGVFGNSLALANTLASIPDVMPFSLQPFLTQRVTDGQASGRFGASYQVTRKTILRGSYSQLFEPPPVDLFVMPPNVNTYAVPGILINTPRPMRAARGQLVDVGVEQQVGSRLVARTNLYYKQLQNFGDSGVIANTPIYNRQTLDRLESYGVESRIDLKTSREGFGLNGFLSNTIQVAYLRGCKCTTGGNWQDPAEAVLAKYADHDRRYSMKAGLGYKARNNLWMLAEIGVSTGLQDQRDPAIFGVHPARTPVLSILGLNVGWTTPKEWRKSVLVPDSLDLRMDNLLNQRILINAGSPFQGTRYSLPLRVLAGAYWKV